MRVTRKSTFVSWVLSLPPPGVGPPVTCLLFGQIGPLPGSKPHRAGGGRIQGTEHSPCPPHRFDFVLCYFLASDPVVSKLFFLRRTKRRTGRDERLERGSSSSTARLEFPSPRTHQRRNADANYLLICRAKMCFSVV